MMVHTPTQLQFEFYTCLVTHLHRHKHWVWGLMWIDTSDLLFRYFLT